MTNTTDVYWSVDGQSLQTLCRNVETLAPKWGNFPPRRGSNPRIAYRHGSQHREKYMDSRTVSLGMWVTGDTADGGTPANGQERQFNDNMLALQSLIWNSMSDQVTLTKRWKDPLTGDVVSASALAEVTNDMNPTMVGPFACKFVVDFFLADPLFYGEQQEDTLPLAGLTLESPGTVESQKILLIVNGALTNVNVKNTSYDPEISVLLSSSVATDDFVILDVDQFTALRDSDDANLIGSVTRSGARSWMKLGPGENVLTLTASSGAGDVTVLHQPAYL